MDSNRFDRARATPGYKAAFLDDVPGSRMRVAGIVAGIAILVPFIVLLAAIRPFAAVAMGAAAVIGVATLAVTAIVESRAPVVRQLAIVTSTWTGLRGGNLELQRVARSITLRDAFGLERDFRMSSQVVGDAQDGAIGVATIRHGTVIQFAVLDA